MPSLKVYKEGKLCAREELSRRGEGRGDARAGRGRVRLPSKFSHVQCIMRGSRRRKGPTNETAGYGRVYLYIRREQAYNLPRRPLRRLQCYRRAAGEPRGGRGAASSRRAESPSANDETRTRIPRLDFSAGLVWPAAVERRDRDRGDSSGLAPAMSQFPLRLVFENKAKSIHSWRKILTRWKCEAN